MKKYLLIILISLTVFTLSSCNKNRFIYDENKINVVTTTNIIGDLARSIGGEQVHVFNLMDAYVDPHSYLPRPSDLNAIKKADIVLASGLNLEAKMVNIFENLPNDKIYSLIGNELINSAYGHYLIESDDFGGNYDPHFWFNITLYKEAAKVVTNILKSYDTNNSSYYQNNLDEYLILLDELEINVTAILNSLNLEKIVLITAHDAFGYLEIDYNFEVHSLQGLSTAAEVSPLKIKEIANLVTNNNVKAIFPETSVPVETIYALREAIYQNANYNIKIGGLLASDSLGNTELDNTYLKMYLNNIKTIVTALGDD